MALIDKASLLMVPSTYEAGKLYNVLPSGNRAPDSTDQNSGYDQTRADFDFDRGSNAAASRINSSGLIEKYRENLFTNSNMFTGISLDGITRTTAQADPFGGNNAVLFTESTNTGTHRWYNTSAITSSAVYTISVFAKANGVTDLQIAGAAGIIGRFDLSTGEAFTSGIGIDANIKAIGTDGWYRCSATYNGGGWIGLYLAQGTAISYTGDGTSGVYAYGYQVEKGLVATDYLDSTSVTGKAGVLVDLPRINFDANGENGSLLLEPSRQQLVQYSEYFGGWSKATGGTGSNPVLDFGYTSPEGIDNAYKVTFNKGAGTTTSDLSVLQTSFTSASNTASFYVKADAATRLMVRNSGTWAIYDITTEWTRIEKTDTGGSLQIGLREGYGLSDVPNSCSVYLYGAQVEASASYPSSYIPNHGESGGVTRAADSCSVTGASDVIGQTEGTMFVEFMTPETNSYFIHAVSDGTNNNKVQIEYNTTTDTLIGIVRVSGVTEVSIPATGMTPNTRYKAAIAYKANDFVFYVNGTQKGTDTSGSVPSSMSAIHLGSQVGTFFESGEVYNATLFNERLSNAELATLTTL
jgi:hypothetical protein